MRCHDLCEMNRMLFDHSSSETQQLALLYYKVKPTNNSINNSQLQKYTYIKKNFDNVQKLQKHPTVAINYKKLNLKVFFNFKRFSLTDNKDFSTRVGIQKNLPSLLKLACWTQNRNKWFCFKFKVSTESRSIYCWYEKNIGLSNNLSFRVFQAATVNERRAIVLNVWCSSSKLISFSSFYRNNLYQESWDCK